MQLVRDAHSFPFERVADGSVVTIGAFDLYGWTKTLALGASAAASPPLFLRTAWSKASGFRSSCAAIPGCACLHPASRSPA